MTHENSLEHGWHDDLRGQVVAGTVWYQHLTSLEELQNHLLAERVESEDMGSFLLELGYWDRLRGFSGLL